MEEAAELLRSAARVLIEVRNLSQPRAGMYTCISEINLEGVSFVLKNTHDDDTEYFDFTYAELDAAMIVEDCQ